MPATNEKAPVVLRGRDMVIPGASRRIGVRGDRNAESITFMLDRFYDGIDFLGKDIYLEYYTQRNRKYDIAKVDYTENDEHMLVFEWVVTPLAAAVKGTVKIRIKVMDGEEYVWQSYDGAFTIEETFIPTLPMPPPGLSVVDELLLQIKAMLDELIDMTQGNIVAQVNALTNRLNLHLKDFSNPHQVTEDQLLPGAMRLLLEGTTGERPYTVAADGKVTYVDNLTDAGQEVHPNDIGVNILF